ncbi:MAG: hypothetical protein ABWK00_06865 [Desulfurococcaceae archaeon]
MIPRFFFMKHEDAGLERIGAGGILRFLGAPAPEVFVRRYVAHFAGIAAQPEGQEGLVLVRPGDIIVLEGPAGPYCQWHSGRLDERGDPLGRRYCTSEAKGELGFCQEHARSEHALYYMCFASVGRVPKECEELDRLMGNSVEYAVYVVAVGRGKLKVGSTRLWRLVERIGEQPHVLAAAVKLTRSAVEARRLEARLGEVEGFSEQPGRRTFQRAREDLGAAAMSILSGIEKASKALGEDLGATELFRVEPGEPEVARGAREAELGELLGRRLELLGYHMGYLFLGIPGSSDRLAIRGGGLLHGHAIKLSR